MLPVLLDPAKFKDAWLTARGETRAHVELKTLETLWFNTGTLCNLTCRNCYIESSPRNDRLVYLTAAEVADYLDEIERDGHATRLIGFTGGEPFMNPDLPAMLDDVLSRGLKAMVLTNAMKPMHKMKPALLELRARHGSNLTIRVSVDHYEKTLHEEERGLRSWKPTIDGLAWLGEMGFDVHVAGRHFSNETDEEVRAGYARLFVSNTTIANNAGTGFYAQVVGAANGIDVTADRIAVSYNGTGMLVSAFGSDAISSARVTNSVITFNSQMGLQILGDSASGGIARGYIDMVNATNNGSYDIRSTGRVYTEISRSTGSNVSGQFTSYGNNQIDFLYGSSVGSKALH